MLRSELIEILQETTRNCQRDGDVLIEIVTNRKDQDGMDLCDEVTPVIGVSEMLGWGKAITVIQIAGND